MQNFPLQSQTEAIEVLPNKPNKPSKVPTFADLKLIALQATFAKVVDTAKPRQSFMKKASTVPAETSICWPEILNEPMTL